jgi:uncharacterized protein (UPF0305 family)
MLKCFVLTCGTVESQNSFSVLEKRPRHYATLPTEHPPHVNMSISGNAFYFSDCPARSWQHIVSSEPRTLCKFCINSADRYM